MLEKFREFWRNPIWETNKTRRRLATNSAAGTHTHTTYPVRIYLSFHPTTSLLSGVDGGAHGGGGAGPQNVPPALMHSVHSAGPTNQTTITEHFYSWSARTRRRRTAAHSPVAGAYCTSSVLARDCARVIVNSYKANSFDKNKVVRADNYKF